MSPDLPPVIPDFPAAWLYDPTGQTLIGELVTAFGIQWIERLNQVGEASFSVLLSDPLAGSIGDRSIVKFSLNGAIRTGVQIRGEECDLAVDAAGARAVQFNNQPDLFAMLNAGTVLPEKGLSRSSDSVRRFGWMSSPSIGSWYSAGDWARPLGYTWAADVSSRAGKPVDFKPYGTDVYWIAKGNPATSVAAGTVQYFRVTVTTVTDLFTQLLAAFDDYGQVFLDGQEVISPNYSTGQSWRQADTVPDLHVPSGTHDIAVKIENAPLIPGHTNPVAFALALIHFDGTGNPVGLVTQSDLTWDVWNTSGEPGWHRGGILHQAVGEMVALADVNDVNAFTLTFTATTDTHGDAWADATTSELSFPIGQTGLGDMATALCADGPLDVWVDAALMTLNARNRTDGTNRRGSDVSASVAFKLGDSDGTLTAYKTTKAWTRYTAALVQRADGAWSSVDDTAGIAAVGRVYASLSLGSTGSELAGLQQTQQALNDSAAPLTSVQAEAAAFGDGPKLYDDYNLGDTAKCPGHRAVGTMKARVLSVSVDATTDLVRTWPSDLVEDLSV